MIQRITDLRDYFKQYDKSIQEPEKFWAKIAKTFTWQKKWDKVLKYNLHQAEVNWFVGGKLNITENCIDRHAADTPDKVALLFEPNNPNDAPTKITYFELYEQVNQLANVLKAQGVQKGDRVCIYLPMISQLPISVLACARIGAIHSVVFAGFSASALRSRIEDAACKIVITADGGKRGDKVIDLKNIVDNAVNDVSCVECVLVVKHTQTKVAMDELRDKWLEPLIDRAAKTCEPEMMDAEDPLFILYTSGSTGKPKGMVHTCGGYMVYAAYSFQQVFQYEENDIYWCSADVGWITGHSYIIYGPLLNGATSLLFEGVPSFPDYGRFWQVIEKYGVNQFYTAPTAIRVLAKQPSELVEKYDLSSLKVIGTVGEPINEEAWHWYDKHVGKGKCPIVDTWFQTETGGIMISPIPYSTPTKPTFATWPLPGVQLVLMDPEGNEIQGKSVDGNLCISFPWPSMARTIWGDHQRYIDTYFSAYPGYYFTGDGSLRDQEGYYRITGRVDDVIIVSGHNLGTAPIEDAINEHPLVIESAVVGVPHDIKGNALYGFVTINDHSQDKEQLTNELNAYISERVGPIAKVDYIQFTNGLPKTRSGKIMRRILRKVATGDLNQLGDTSTLLNPECVEDIIKGKL
ncbi:MAG: acetate--CoA ligase [Crocinitomicaceae bacterium]|nr:acetate--CoA ligase [Crocinitomicaceae bacterium]